MSTFLWILTGILATGLFLYARKLPDPPEEKKQ
jgi:hypothetical protein